MTRVRRRTTSSMAMQRSPDCSRNMPVWAERRRCEMLRLFWRLGRRAWNGLRLLPIRAAVALGSAGLGERARPEQLWRAMAIVVPVGLLAWWAIPQVTLVMSPSIEAWAVRASPGRIGKGDYVMFMLSHPLAGPRPVNVTKHA